MDKLPNPKELNKIDIKEEISYNILTKYVNDFLYLVVKPYNQIESFQVNNMENTYILSCDSLTQQIKFIK